LVFQTRYPNRDTAKDEQLKTSLRRRLFTFAASDFSNLEALEANLITASRRITS
jgi:hypothetical protein